MYTHPSSFQAVGLVRENGSSDMKLFSASADFSLFFVSFLFSLLIFLLMLFSLGLSGAVRRRKPCQWGT